MANALPDIITASEAGQILDRSARTVARLIESGALPAVRKLPGPNGDYLLHRSDVEQLRDERALAG